MNEDGGTELLNVSSSCVAPNLEQKVGPFYSSIKSRVLVSEVVNRIRSGAMWTFDYVALVVLASIISFFGLLEDSSVVLVASMLVSPIMGPILAGIFGAVILDKPLRNKGIIHELLSLLLCICMGFVLGFRFGIPFLGSVFGFYSG